MGTILLQLHVKFQDLMSREEGQDLIEYALLAALIALGAVTAMRSLSTGITAIFTTISTNLSAA